MKIYPNEPVYFEGTPEELNTFMFLQAAQANMNQQMQNLQTKLDEEKDE